MTAKCTKTSTLTRIILSLRIEPEANPKSKTRLPAGRFQIRNTNMAELKAPRPRTENEAVVERAKDAWGQYGKAFSIGFGAAVLLFGGWLIYKNFVQGPKEKKAADAIVRVQNAYDSLYSQTGELQPKFVDLTITEAEKVTKQYGGTPSANLAHFYAGAAHVKKGQFDKAISHLKDFDGDDTPQIQARAFKLLGDAYAETGKNNEAYDHYKKAGRQLEDDDAAASEALFYAAYMADKVLNKKDEAKELYKEVRTKYTQTQWAYEAEKYLATLGVYEVE